MGLHRPPPAPGVAPITLVDGDALIDMLIEHGIGVRKRKIEILTVDLDGRSVESPEEGQATGLWKLDIT